MGLAKDDGGKYLIYSPVRKGACHQLIAQVQSAKDAVSVGEVAAEVALTSRSGILRVEQASTATDSVAGSSADALPESYLTEDESDAESDGDEA